jgi:hypothetical protein
MASMDELESTITAPRLMIKTVRKNGELRS